VVAPEPPRSSPPRRALIVRLSALGDVVHTLPVAAALRRDGWRVSWLVETQSAGLLLGNPAIDRVFTVPSPRAFRPGRLLRSLGALRAHRFDVAIDVQGLWKSALWSSLARARRRIGFARTARREGASALLPGEGVTPPADARHVIERNLSLLVPLGLRQRAAFEFPLPPLDGFEPRRPESIAAQPWERIVVLHPGGGWTSKLWPVERWAELASALAARGWTGLVSWGPGEELLAREVVERSASAAVAADATGLLQLAALARRAAALIAADTGPLHLACAAGARVVGLYGPTDPARNGPWSDRSAIVSRRPPCAPCHRRRCSRHAGILAAIPVPEVIDAVDRLVL